MGLGCKEVRRVIYFLLDGAVGENKKRDLDDHLGHCPDCGTRKTIQVRLRNFVRRRLARMPAPERLRTRVSRSLRALQAD